MRLTPREPEIPEVGGFNAANDIFGYRDFAERLCNLIRRIEEPLVITLDGPWGSGKSIFVKQWAGLLRQNGAQVIMFDAFGNDHYEDAFLALSSQIYGTAKEVLGGNESSARRYLNHAKKAGKLLAPIALRVATRAGTAGLVSLDDIEEGGEAIKAAVKSLGNESAKALEKTISERLRSAAEERDILAGFRTTLSELATNLTEQNDAADQTYPLVIIIDELDRCRPPFALSVIERIKHLFSVPGVCFILVTHLPQLQQAVQGAYGATFDAPTYLEKFYQLRIELPEATNQIRNQRFAYLEHLWRELEIGFPEQGIGDAVQRQFKALADVHELSLRQLERAMSHLALVCAAAGPGHLIIPAIVAGLCIMRQKNSELYREAKNGGLTWDQSRQFLQPREGQGVQDDRTLNFWRYATGEDLPADEMRLYGQGLARYDVDRRENLVPIMARLIDDLAQRRNADDN